MKDNCTLQRKETVFVCVKQSGDTWLWLEWVLLGLGRGTYVEEPQGPGGDAWSRGAASLSCPQMEAQIELVGLRKLNLPREPPPPLPAPHWV